MEKNPNKNFTDFNNEAKMKGCSRYTSKRAICAE